MSAANNHAFNALPRFIWGEAVDDLEAGDLIEIDYLTHTRYPRFVCRVEGDERVYEWFRAQGVGEDTLHMQSGSDDNGRPVIGVSNGLRLSGFAWIDRAPTGDELAEVIRAAMADWLLRQDAYEGLEE